ncbi:hypothetical protein LH460_06390 [Laribacter hongkongensis]|nr:hypothetical protein [Laribacter hongkongensis]
MGEFLEGDGPAGGQTVGGGKVIAQRRFGLGVFFTQRGFLREPGRLLLS